MVALGNCAEALLVFFMQVDQPRIEREDGVARSVIANPEEGLLVGIGGVCAWPLDVVAAGPGEALRGEHSGEKHDNHGDCSRA